MHKSITVMVMSAVLAMCGQPAASQGPRLAARLSGMARRAGVMMMQSQRRVVPADRPQTRLFPRKVSPIICRVAENSGVTPVVEGQATPEEGKKVDSRPLSSNWELDIYSRPVVSNGKKLWELLLCDETGQYRYATAISPDKVNSKEVNRLLREAIQEAPIKPRNIRYFRKQAVSIISKALESLDTELNIRGIKSRATYAMFDWLKERTESVYPKMEGYQGPKKQAKSQFMYTRPATSLPQYLEGEDWSFCEVQLDEILRNTKDMTEPGRVCEVPDGYDGKTMVPGLVVYSPRAKALAVALKGASIQKGDLSSVSVDGDRNEVVYDIGVEDKWRIGKLDDDRLVAEGTAFEANKEKLGGLHFLAIHQLPQVGLMDFLLNRRKSTEDEEVEGFWLMRQANYGWEKETFQ
ncbi:hypothetical protein AAMO2058_000665600 [Amorphochlora amoebiformis]|mmetsp:Transcript_30143/g.48319  ORF Transcript_30143/g.48319 Transcript_30143/m.48319 type:complete len:408 (-) Transcript_30143:91-1314(-)